MALIQKRIDDFFNKSDALKTFNNLCIHLQLTKATFIANMNADPDTYTMALEKCEAWMIDNGLQNPKSGNFTQFLLRHQFEYNEQQEVEQNTPSEIVISLA
jgi:hypothetical protein